MRYLPMVSPSSFLRLLGFPGLSSARSGEKQLERARSAMLALLHAHVPSDETSQRVRQRVQFATNLEALWYLRQDVLVALSEAQDDATARRQLRKINGLFKGALPGSMEPRVHHRYPV